MKFRAVLVSGLALSAALLAIIVPGTARAVDFVAGDYDGSQLWAQLYSVPAGQSLTVQTTGCTAGGGQDTIIFILEGNRFIAGSVTKTAAFNDDDSSSGTFCSLATVHNTSGASKDYTAVVTTYVPNAPAAVTLRTQITPNAFVQQNVTIGGMVSRFAGDHSAETLQTVPLRTVNGGVPFVDSIIFAIDPTIGGTAHFDDDNGPRRFSKTTNLNCPVFQTCYVVSGDYSGGTGVGNLQVWSQGSSPDSDGDGISDDVEDMLVGWGRLPNGAKNTSDSDGDGLSDFVEMMGVPAAVLAGGDSSLVMPWQDADPAQQDLFVEIDSMVASGDDHHPYANLGADLTAIFLNDTAFTSRSIRPHVEISQSLPHTTGLAFGNCKTGSMADRTNFYTIKNNPAFFDPLRVGVYHYVIFGHVQTNPEDCSLILNSGVAELLGNDVIVTLNTGNGTTDKQRGTQVHELGHNLYLSHNGNDDKVTYHGYGCVHSSVMNYRWQMGGWSNAGNTLRSFGYSRGQCLSRNGAGTQQGIGDCSVTSNTCTGGCVPAGQVTLKATCPVATSGPNMGKNVSDGTCDCDLDEWLKPTSTPIPGQVSLQFQGSFFNVEAGAGVSMNAAEAQYLHGGSSAVTAGLRKVADRKRAFLERQGLKEGVHFRQSESNGKFYSIE